MPNFHLSTVVWTALITPFTAEGEVDYDCLTTLIEQQQAAGNGILLLGSTGEGLALSADEQKRIVLHACSMQLSVPLMVAVGGFNLAMQRDWMTFCNALPIDAYLLASPIYAKPGEVGQRHWFQTLLDIAEKPCMLYNVPSRSGVELNLQALATLQLHPQCWAIKEASGQLSSFKRFREYCPELALFCGDDGLMPLLAQHGAKGLVSVCANVWPTATQQYVRAALTGQLTAEKIWHEATASLFTVANPIPVKILMHHLQMLRSPLLRAPLTHEELTQQSQLLNAHQQVTDWTKQQIIERDLHP